MCVTKTALCTCLSMYFLCALFTTFSKKRICGSFLLFCCNVLRLCCCANLRSSSFLHVFQLTSTFMKANCVLDPLYFGLSPFHLASHQLTILFCLFCSFLSICPRSSRGKFHLVLHLSPAFSCGAFYLVHYQLPFQFHFVFHILLRA